MVKGGSAYDKRGQSLMWMGFFWTRCPHGKSGQMYLKHLGISAEADLGEILSPMSLEEAARYLIDHYGLKWKPEEVVRGINQELKEFYEHQVLLKPGVEIYVNEFCRRNIPMAIATSGDRENAEAALDRLGVLSYFEGICTCFGNRMGEKPSGRLLCGGASSSYESKRNMDF